ncbi:phage virion morphogenesis protein [Comamonas koreensis]|uniref:phage virion morphogenesis protein n=1 Tax=Comamonas koreensis TaxID=160825 RepID=UPI0022A925E6|nr:phage virion morphogenesis protein [Comamonas koreensis]
MATAQGASVSISLTDTALQERLQAVPGLDTTPLMSRLGEYFQKSTQDRFKTQTDPDGNAWAPLSPGYLKRKKQNSNLILTLNAYLRRGIHYQVQSAVMVAWGSNSLYAAIHNAGGNGTGINGKMKKRQFAGLSAADNAEALDIVQDWYHRRLNGLPD